MSNIHDPNNDVRDKQAPYREIDAQPERGGLWGWIAGGVVIALLILVFAFGTGSGDKTASNPAAPNTATRTVPPATPGQTRTPMTPSENTGRAPSAPAAPSTPAPQ
jgi:hypothetical protein